MATTTARRDSRRRAALSAVLGGQCTFRSAQDNRQQQGFVDVEHPVEILATCATCHVV